MSYKIQARITIKIQGIYILSKLTQLSVAGLKANTIPTHSRHSENGSLGNFLYKLSGEKNSQSAFGSFFFYSIFHSHRRRGILDEWDYTQRVHSRERQKQFPETSPYFFAAATISL